MDLWWKDKGYKQVLYNTDFGVGEVKRPFGATHVAIPWWDEKEQTFNSEEDAKAWLATVYRLEHSIN